ncbi:hypothetical protein AB9K41_25535, partial [Cribrihabitans sp. XS_ASV171]
GRCFSCPVKQHLAVAATLYDEIDDTVAKFVPPSAAARLPCERAVAAWRRFEFGKQFLMR